MRRRTARGHYQLQDSYLASGSNKFSLSQPGAFFLNTESKPVVKSWFVNQIREVLGTLGVPQHDYAGHSFRIGAATTAAMAGVEDSTIQTLGRWHSSAFLQYVRTPKERLASLSATLAKSSSGPVQG